MSNVREYELRARYEAFRAQNLQLDMTRGKPSSEHLDLSLPMRSNPNYVARDGSDCRNYGCLEGLPEARELFGAYLGMPAQNTFVLGNSSLAIMHDIVVQATLRPLSEGACAWGEYRSLGKQPAILCPVPGYDRHFSISQLYGIDMIPVPMNESGPDMDLVMGLVKNPFVVGMWCTPKYSNPSGATYSSAMCRRLAWLKTANQNFRIFWDLAYLMHDLEESGDELPNFFELCCEAEHENRPFMVGSTSKITFPGGGLGILAASKSNLAWFRTSLFAQTIGGDKLNQLQHVEFFRGVEGIRAHMRKHAAIVKPKFDVACEIFERELGGIATWKKPRGGYFIALQVQPGCAKKTVALAGEIGVKLTPAGATHPYGNDPADEWIRFAPTFPSVEEVGLGAEVLAVCARIAAES